MARGGNQGGRSSLQHLARRALLIGKYLCVGNRRKSAKNTFGCQSRVRNGATALLDLLDAQRVQLQAEDAYAESHSYNALSAVLLYKSLAGGWPQHLPPSPRGGTP